MCNNPTEVYNIIFIKKLLPELVITSPFLQEKERTYVYYLLFYVFNFFTQIQHMNLCHIAVMPDYETDLWQQTKNNKN